MKIKKVFRIPQKMLWAFVLEGIETKEMMTTFVKMGKGRLLFKTSSKGPTDEEMKKALEQLKDIPRFLPFLMCAVVPAPGITEGYILVAMTLEKWLGQKFSLLPYHFRNIFQKDDTSSEPIETTTKENQ